VGGVRHPQHIQTNGWVGTVFPLSHDNCRQPRTSVKPEAAITVFELVMVSGVSLETCWAIKKHWNNKFYYTVTTCLLFLYNLDLRDISTNDTRYHQWRLMST
jgi:hypothetical protein